MRGASGSRVAGVPWGRYVGCAFVYLILTERMMWGPVSHGRLAFLPVYGREVKMGEVMGIRLGRATTVHADSVESQEAATRCGRDSDMITATDAKVTCKSCAKWAGVELAEVAAVTEREVKVSRLSRLEAELAGCRAAEVTEDMLAQAHAENRARNMGTWGGNGTFGICHVSDCPRVAVGVFKHRHGGYMATCRRCSTVGTWLTGIINPEYVPEEISAMGAIEEEATGARLIQAQVSPVRLVARVTVDRPWRSRVGKHKVTSRQRARVRG